MKFAARLGGAGIPSLKPHENVKTINIITTTTTTRIAVVITP